MFIVPAIVSAGMAAFASTSTFLVARLLAARHLSGGGPSVAIGVSHAPWVGAPPLRKIAFALSGPIALYAVAAIVFAASYWFGGKSTTDPKDMHLWVLPDGPAANAGIRGGDEILSVDDEPTTSWPSFTEQVLEHGGAPVHIAVRHRDGQTQSFDVTAGPTGKIGVIGQSKIAHVGLGSAIAMGAVEPAYVWSVVLRNVGKLLTGDPNVHAIGPAALGKHGGRATVGGTLGRVATIVSYHFIIIATLLSLLFWPGARWFASTKKANET